METHAGRGGHGGHGDHAGVFRRRFWLSLVVSLPVVALSPMFAMLLGYQVPDGLGWIAPALGTAVFFYGGWPFLTGARDEIASLRPGMMLLIGMAITVAFVASLAASLGLVTGRLNFWWELVLLVDIMLLGHWLEMRALGAASGALDALAALLPDEAERVTDYGVETVPAGDLRAGDLVLVRSGGRVPADGLVREGAAEFDESMITGESRPVARGVDDRVVAGTVATDTSVRVEVTAVGEDTALAGIRRMVADAQASRSRAQALADRAAALLFYYAAGAAVITALVWSIAGSGASAVEKVVTVLVIACPHALGLAIPLVIAIATELSARQGILVKDRMALERMRDVRAVLFDKTGTLTEGSPVVTAVATAPGWTEDRMLVLAAAAEADSEHPLARAVVARAGAHPSAADFRSLTGRGVRARVDGLTVEVGGPALLRASGIADPVPAAPSGDGPGAVAVSGSPSGAESGPGAAGERAPRPGITRDVAGGVKDGSRTVTADGVVPASVAGAVAEWAGRGAAVLYVLADGVVAGALAVEDAVRPESLEAVRELRRAGVHVAMITGDARQVADAVAAGLGVDEVFAEVLPGDKDAKVAELQARGMRVAMVGDGVNDAPALARADVGIAIGAGTDVAIQSAGVVLAADDPRLVASVRRLSAAVYRKMLQNLAWAAGYNLLTVPLAAGALAWAGISLPMEIGAILMSLSTVVVALNAQLLRRLNLRPPSTS